MNDDGVVGLFNNEDGVMFCNIRKGDAGIPFEELLPPEMRGEGFTDAPVSSFIGLSYIFFATSQQWEKWRTDIKPGQQQRKLPPSLDVKALKLEGGVGQIDYERLRHLYSLIWPYWQTKPPIGMIAHCIKWNIPGEEIATILKMHHRYGDKVKDLDRCFVDVFMPPNIAEQGHIVTNEQLEYAFEWCRRPDRSGKLKQDSLKWALNFRELGIISHMGIVNHKIARLARNFIWADMDREPDYFVLKAHLEPHLPKQERAVIKTPDKPLPKAHSDKLKKRKRKSGKIRRRK